MPQLIAMVIVVVGAMIYMFQTFGGTGDKIEGIAQKTSAISEINNIKTGLKLAARAEHIGSNDGTVNDADDARFTLEGLARLGYFQEQINRQLAPNENAVTDAANVYNALSFGADGSMRISLVNDVHGAIPGIFVDFNNAGASPFFENRAFLEAQIANDLGDSAVIDRGATTASAGAVVAANNVAGRTPADNGDGGTDTDGMFIIYFQDFGPNEVVGRAL